jgi:(2Fe-2S) ferredoxin
MMHTSHTHQSSTFSLEGRFLGFIREGSTFKYLRLAIAKEELQIKLSQESRASCQTRLTPNDIIQVIGEMSVSRELGELKLKATQIISLNQQSGLNEIEPSVQETSLAPAVSERRSTYPQMKLLMCQKSGCQKKGGRKQRQAIATLLRDRNLQDHVVIQETGCLGKCSLAPNLVLMPGKRWLSGMTPDAIVEVLTTCLTENLRKSTRGVNHE